MERPQTSLFAAKLVLKLVSLKLHNWGVWSQIEALHTKGREYMEGLNSCGWQINTSDAKFWEMSVKYKYKYKYKYIYQCKYFSGATWLEQKLGAKKIIQKEIFTKKVAAPWTSNTNTKYTNVNVKCTNSHCIWNTTYDELAKIMLSD